MYISCCWPTMEMASVVLVPGTKVNCISSMFSIWQLGNLAPVSAASWLDLWAWDHGSYYSHLIKVLDEALLTVYWDHTTAENSFHQFSDQPNSFFISILQHLSYNARRAGSHAAFHIAKCSALRNLNNIITFLKTLHTYTLEPLCNGYRRWWPSKRGGLSVVTRGKINMICKEWCMEHVEMYQIPNCSETFLAFPEEIHCIYKQQKNQSWQPKFCQQIWFCTKLYLFEFGVMCCMLSTFHVSSRIVANISESSLLFS